MEVSPNPKETIDTVSIPENDVSLRGLSKVTISIRNTFKGLRAELHDFLNPVADAGYEYSLPFSHYEGPIDPCDDLVEDYFLMYGPPPKSPEEKIAH